MLSEKVIKFIEKERLLSPNGHYLLALSGGADSVALLRVMLSLNLNLEAVHCNFHLRGEESDRDELFCKKLCQQLNVDLHIAHFDTDTYAKAHKISIEMAARELRYDYFEKLRKDLSFDAICVAHHKDDSVETILLNLIRGTGVNGLKGISPKNAYIIRPLLCVSRTEITDYLSAIKQDYIIDSSNLQTDFQRNKIRLNIIPLLKEITSSACDNILKSAEHIRDIIPVFESYLFEAKNKVVQNDTIALKINIEQLKKELAPETVLWYILKDKDFSSLQVRQIYENIDAESGREWISPTHSLVFNRGYIIVESSGKRHKLEKLIPETGVYYFENNSCLRVSKQQVNDKFEVSKKKELATLDAAKVKFPLTIRNLKSGDWFVPFGMTGKKLLSDFLTDRKLSVFEKRRQLVVVDSGGAIVWVVGVRTDNRFRISDSSREALVLQFTF
jgi:tRNA(Ile)-lysidine synthase